LIEACISGVWLTERAECAAKQPAASLELAGIVVADGLRLRAPQEKFSSSDTRIGPAEWDLFIARRLVSPLYAGRRLGDLTESSFAGES
jgi:hypothetical protein